MGWVFLRSDEVLEIQSKLIELFGGSEGLRDEGALTSALLAAENREHYQNADLAVSLTLQRNHCGFAAPQCGKALPYRRLLLI